MRVGATIINQNYTDWDRYEAEERGEKVSARASKPDHLLLGENVGDLSGKFLVCQFRERNVVLFKIRLDFRVLVLGPQKRCLETSQSRRR